MQSATSIHTAGSRASWNQKRESVAKRLKWESVIVSNTERFEDFHPNLSLRISIKWGSIPSMTEMNGTGSSKYCFSHKNL